MKVFAINSNYQIEFGQKKKHNTAKVLIPAAMLSMIPINSCNNDMTDTFEFKPVNKEISVSNDISASLNLPYNDKTINDALDGKTIVIDAGHGGRRKSGNIESGSVYRNPKTKEVVYEKDITLAVAKEVQKYLGQTNANIIMVRDSDYYVELEDRALSTKGDAYISIHCDYNVQSKKPKGASVYVYKPSEKNGKPTAHKPYIDKENRELASSIINNMEDPFDLKVRSLHLKTLRLSDSIRVPNVLVELAFLSNDDDVQKLTDKNSQKDLGKQVAGGIVKYFVKKNENCADFLTCNDNK